MTPEVPLVDRVMGMSSYATPGARHAGSIRSQREDFRVQEIFDLSQVEQKRREGYVPVYALVKFGLDTPHASMALADSLKSKVNFAGMKDSDALTTQYVSARSSRADDPETVTGRGFEARRVGYMSRPVTRGMASGNSFRIIVRSEEDLTDAVSAVFDACATKKVPNYFGYQRFGLKSAVNHKVGRAVIERDFKGAINLLIGDPRRDEAPEAAEGRRMFIEGRYKDARDLFSPKQDIERRVSAYLAERPGDHLGAFRRVPIVPRRLFVQSYQAYLFNLTMSRASAEGEDLASARNGDNWAELAQDRLQVGRVHGVRENISGEAVPLVQLVGYAFRNYGSRFDAIILEVLRQEGVEPSWFYLKEAEEVSNEGGFRHAPLLATDMNQDRVDGGVRLGFKLGRGEYATTLLRELLKPEDPLASGF